MDIKEQISCPKPLNGYQKKIIAMAIKDGCVLLPKVPDGHRKKADIRILNCMVVNHGRDRYRLLYGRFGYSGEYGLQAMALESFTRPTAVAGRRAA